MLGFDLRAYDVARDGRFLMIKDVERPEQTSAPSAGMVIVLNWIDEVRERLPALAHSFDSTGDGGGRSSRRDVACRRESRC